MFEDMRGPFPPCIGSKAPELPVSEKSLYQIWLRFGEYYIFFIKSSLTEHQKCLTINYIRSCRLFFKSILNLASRPFKDKKDICSKYGLLLRKMVRHLATEPPERFLQELLDRDFVLPANGRSLRQLQELLKQDYLLDTVNDFLRLNISQIFFAQTGYVGNQEAIVSQLWEARLFLIKLDWNAVQDLFYTPSPTSSLS